MKLIRHSSTIYEYENFISSDKCDEIINLVESSDVPSSLWNVGRNNVRNNNSINLTDNRINHKNIKTADDEAHSIFFKCHEKYLNDNIILYYMVHNHNLLTVGSRYTYRYYDKSDYYDWHIDSDDVHENLISYLLYLNDDFDGGNLLFLNEKISIIPKKGSMICFPCGLQMIHKSSPIKQGIKKVIWSCYYRSNKNVSTSNRF